AVAWMSRLPGGLGHTASVEASSIVPPVPLALAFVVLLAAPVVIVVPFLPLSLLRPLVSPLLGPVRRPLLLPLLPVSGGDAVVVHRHEQDGSRHDARRDDNPGTVESAARVPAV